MFIARYNMVYVVVCKLYMTMKYFAYIHVKRGDRPLFKDDQLFLFHPKEVVLSGKKLILVIIQRKTKQIKTQVVG